MLPSSAISSQPTASESFKGKKQQFIRFSLEPDTTMMLPIQGITEVLKIALNKIVPIPQMPSWTMGVYNWRGEILWMTDLGHLLGLYSWQEQKINPTSATAIIISSPSGSKAQTTSGKSLGLIIRGVEDVEWCDPQDFQPTPTSVTTPELIPFLSGYWLKEGKEIILALDSNQLIEKLSF